MAHTNYPKTVDLNGAEIRLSVMTPDDEAAVADFALALPSHDLLFVRRDISNPKVVAAWAEAARDGSIWTVLAWRGDKVIGCGAIVRDPLSWSPHLGELRVLVAKDAREIGLGRVLIEACFAEALRLELKKLTAQMTVDQTRAIAIFEELGFRGEALLKEHVVDREGEAHDLAVLSLDVARHAAQLEAYGVGGE